MPLQATNTSDARLVSMRLHWAIRATATAAMTGFYAANGAASRIIAVLGFAKCAEKSFK